MIPANPSLENLKKQAKSLLKGFQSGELEAFERARSHVGGHTSYMNGLTRAIKDRSGTVVGFEVVPRYRPLLYGRSDVVESYYYTDGEGTVHAYIRLDPLVEDHLMFSGGSEAGGFH